MLDTCFCRRSDHLLLCVDFPFFPGTTTRYSQLSATATAAAEPAPCVSLAAVLSILNISQLLTVVRSIWNIMLGVLIMKHSKKDRRLLRGI